MALRGLFIGVNRYQNPGVGWLSCAVRDAAALHALFTDSFGDGLRLLVDGAATRFAVEAEFAKLADCDEDDVVVVTFSGHGSETHELVVTDTDPHALPTTGIPLDLLTEWFSKIPARRLVCVLDCCFSGGAGAKVLHVEHKARDVRSTDAFLNQLSGEGRLILTASSASEPAWESSRKGHGYLTLALLEALQGAEEVRKAGKVSVYRLLEYVTERVRDAAAAFGKQQNPAVRGTVDGEFLWPLMLPGTLYSTRFPDRSKAVASADVHSLRAFGLPDALTDAWSEAIPSLNQLQIDAINEFRLLDGEHLLVTAPTSSGKTMVGELAALNGIVRQRRAVFLLPLKALVNDKYQEFRRRYEPLGMRILRATGDINEDDSALVKGRYDIALLTYEKFAGLAISAPHILEKIGTVVVDEAQMIADSSRGANLEFLLTLLKVRRRQGSEPQLLALSAVIGDTNGFERWLGGRLLRREERPVPIDEGMLTASGSFRFVSSDTGQESSTKNFSPRIYGKGSSQDWVIPLVGKLVSEGKQVIVFREEKGLARGCANYLANSLGLPAATRAIEALPLGDPSQASTALRQALSQGVAFHIADLEPAERLAVEEEFRRKDSQIRVIAATTTLAMGVNTPTEAVVIVGLMHPQKVPYSVAEYKNMAGRAGRLGMAERGASYLLALNPAEEVGFWRDYVAAKPEDVTSRFIARDTDLRSQIIKILVASQRAQPAHLAVEDVVAFLEESFGAFLLSGGREWSWNVDHIDVAISSLRANELIEVEDGRLALTPLGRIAARGGIEVESVIRVSQALSAIEADSLSDLTLLTAVQLTKELDDVHLTLNKSSTQKEPQEWPNELRRQGVAYSLVSALQRHAIEPHFPTARAKRAVACVLWTSHLPMAQVELHLTQFGRKDGVAGPVRNVAARTLDLLPSVCEIASHLHPSLRLEERLPLLLARLATGTPGDLAAVAAVLGSTLTRGEYLSLRAAGLVSLEALRDCDDARLLECLSGSAAKFEQVRNSVERAIGERPEELPPIPLF